MVKPQNTLASDILFAWETEREQLAVLLIAVVRGLETRSETEYAHYREWRLAQVAVGLVDNLSMIDLYREMAGGAR